MSRRAMIAKIHIAKQQLGLDDSTYREILRRHGGQGDKPSSAKMDDRQLDKVLQELVRKGFKPKQPKKGNRPHNYDRLPGYITKVEALLADMGLSWAYADSIARNITGGVGAPEIGKDPGVERLAWVRKDDHWRAIIAALVKEQEKRGHHAAILEELKEMGLEESYIEQLLVTNAIDPKNWHRRTALMVRIRQYLEAKRGKQS